MSAENRQPHRPTRAAHGAPASSRPSASRPRPSRSRPACTWWRRRSAICSDVSFRALSVLAAADAVLAEDTRVTKTLLAHYGITTPLVAYHEHSNDAVRERMVAPPARGAGAGAGLGCRHAAGLGPGLQARPGGDRGRAAGDPDPRPFRGADRARRRRACRPTASSSRASCRRRAPRGATRLAAIGRHPRHADAVRGAAPPARDAGRRRRVLGERPAVVARELTKLFETVRRGTLPELAATVRGRGTAEGRDRGADRRGHAERCRPPRRMRRSTAGSRRRSHSHSIKDAAALVADETRACPSATSMPARWRSREEKDAMRSAARAPSASDIPARPSRRVDRARGSDAEGLPPAGPPLCGRRRRDRPDRARAATPSRSSR